MPETTATTAPLLADPEELARWLPIPADDPRLLDVLRKASNRFRSAVHWSVHLAEEDLVVLDGDGSTTLTLPQTQVTEVASVQVDGQPLVVGTDVRWSQVGVLRRTSGCWPDRLRALDVVYSHGFDPIPEDIQDVVIEQARLAFSVVPGLSSMQVGGESLTFDSGRPWSTQQIGTTAAWATAVENYRINRGDQA